jgi:hypothetical protein
MLSKWMDVATFMAAYHYQSKIYDTYRPPSFGEHVNLRNRTREREREHVMTQAETVEAMKASLQAKQQQERRNKKRWWMLLPGAKAKTTTHNNNNDEASTATSQADKEKSTKPHQQNNNNKGKKSISGANKKGGVDTLRFKAPRSFHKQFEISANPVLDNNRQARYSMRKLQSEKSSTAIRSTEPIHIPYPSLFLQETAHLVSLLAGVALSTLRNDIEGAPSNLAEYFPGQPMPPVDPDELSNDVRETWNYSGGNKIFSSLYFLLGLSRNDRYRAIYNYNRPFQILGGVSDAEVDRLQRAHGPSAKVALCSMYLKEFIARECLSGSAGMYTNYIMEDIPVQFKGGMSSSARSSSNPHFPFRYAYPRQDPRVYDQSNNTRRLGRDVWIQSSPEVG